MEQMQYNLLFRWFMGLGIDDPVWVPTVSVADLRKAWCGLARLLGLSFSLAKTGPALASSRKYAEF